MTKYTSNAEWPSACGVESSSDTHDTEEAARCVCRMLEENGFGGQGRFFPLRTWVAPVIESSLGRKRDRIIPCAVAGVAAAATTLLLRGCQ